MGGLAAIARAAGHAVTGCDANVYPPMIDAARGARHRADRRLRRRRSSTASRATPTCSSIGNVVSRGNPLMEAILDARPAATCRGRSGCARTCCATSGCWRSPARTARRRRRRCSRGSSSTPGSQPGFLIGGVPLDFGVSARLTDSAFFVIEADEYDTAFFDKRSKFVHYRPRTAILNNLEYDHADIFPDLAAIETQFHHLVRTVPRHGPARRQRRRGEPRARAGARLLERGRALRPRRGRRHRARTGRSPSTARSCSAARRRARSRSAQLGPPQPAECARGDRGRAPRRRAGRARPRRARAHSAACKRRLEVRGTRATASPSTTISRIIRPRSRRRSTACAATSAARASSPCSSRARTR